MPWTKVVFDSFTQRYLICGFTFSVPLATDFQQSGIGIQIGSDDDSRCLGRKRQEESHRL